MVMTIAKNETNRIRSRCQDEAQLEKELKIYNRRLQRNGFNQQEANKVTQHNRRNAKKEPEDRFFLSVPFVSNQLNIKIKKLFQQHGLPIHLAHRGKSLSQILRPETEQQKCKLKNCRCPPKLCFRKMVVYEAICGRCSSNYIGCTKRFLHIRVAEHFSRNDSAIKKHATSCMGLGWTFKIIASSRDLVDLRIQEAYLINLKQPSLNNKGELIPMGLL